MPTLDEVIHRLQVVRNFLNTGDVDVVVVVAGDDGFTTLNMNVVQPVILQETGKMVAVIGCMPKLPAALHKIDLSRMHIG
jgi:hypothetical protein